MIGCIFCKIAKGELDSAKVYEDDRIFAFLDINPVTRGHCLVISKNHYENIFDIDPSVLQHVIIAAQKIAERVKVSLGADGIRLSQSNGKTAGQVVSHFHMHVIPRYKDDGVSMNLLGVEHPPKADMNQLKQLAEKIRLS